jgi:hypothetical protein
VTLPIRRGSLPPNLLPVDAAIKETRAAEVAIKGETNQREAEVEIGVVTSLKAAAVKGETNLKPVVAGKATTRREVVTPLTLAAEFVRHLVQVRNSPEVADSSRPSIARRRSIVRTLANSPQWVRGLKQIRA